LSVELCYSLRACLVASTYGDDNHYNDHDGGDSKVGLVNKSHSMNDLLLIHKKTNDRNNSKNRQSKGSSKDAIATSHTTSDRISMSSFVIMLCTCAMYAFPMEPEIKRINKLFDLLNIKDV